MSEFRAGFERFWRSVELDDSMPVETRGAYIASQQFSTPIPTVRSEARTLVRHALPWRRSDRWPRRLGDGVRGLPGLRASARSVCWPQDRLGCSTSSIASRCVAIRAMLADAARLCTRPYLGRRSILGDGRPSRGGRRSPRRAFGSFVHHHGRGFAEGLLGLDGSDSAFEGLWRNVRIEGEQAQE